jgi:TetR/AcrR family transcriptional regulator, fatty acid metabolism regulator protein
MTDKAKLTNRQQQIIEAALDVISNHGIDSLTIKTLAEKISVTEGALYRHFRSKTDILVAIADSFKTSSMEILEKIVASPTAGLEKIEAFFLGRLAQFTDSPGQTLVMFSENIFKSNNEIHRNIHETMRTHRELLLQAIQEGQSDGNIRGGISPDHLFTIIMGALRLLVTRWWGAGFAFDLRNEGKELWISLQSLLKA